jgi:hypothetical protein
MFPPKEWLALQDLLSEQVEKLVGTKVDRQKLKAGEEIFNNFLETYAIIEECPVANFIQAVFEITEPTWHRSSTLKIGFQTKSTLTPMQEKIGQDFLDCWE